MHNMPRYADNHLVDTKLLFQALHPVLSLPFFIHSTKEMTINDVFGDRLVNTT